MNSTKLRMLTVSWTSSWWNTTLVRPVLLRRVWSASAPRLSFLAVRTTVTRCSASWQAISRPIPLLAPVITARMFEVACRLEMLPISLLLLLSIAVDNYCYIKEDMDVCVYLNWLNLKICQQQAMLQREYDGFKYKIEKQSNPKLKTFDPTQHEPKT